MEKTAYTHCTTDKAETTRLAGEIVPSVMLHKHGDPRMVPRTHDLKKSWGWWFHQLSLINKLQLMRGPDCC